MIYSKIQNYCSENNIIFTVGSNKTLNKYFEVLNKDIQFIGNLTVEERINPKLSLENCNSIIIIGVPYETFKSSKSIGEFSQNSYFDYHKTVEKHLRNISKFLDDKDFTFSVDTGKLFERGLALEYGLGFRGLNTFVINEKFGTYFNIGYILTNHKINVKETKEKICYECFKCIDVCPTKSLENGFCNSNTCISYLTQKKGLLSNDEIQHIGNFLYGCDICQKICPHNKNQKYHNNQFNVNALEILQMTKKEFVKYCDFGFYWRGLGVIKRNAIYNIFNSTLSDIEKITILEEQLLVEKMELPRKALKQVLEILKNKQKL